MSRSSLAGATLLLSLSPSLVFADGFTEDGQTQLQYRQYYWNEDPGNGVGPTRDEWVHALLIDHTSGYYRGFIGLDLGVGVADALAVGSEANNISNLSANDDLQDPDAIAKPTTAYLKMRFGEEGNRLRLGWGKKVRDYHLYADDTTRILPASSIGFDVAYDYRDLALYAARIERFSPRDESGWGDDLSTFDGRAIDSVDLAGASYILPGKLKAEAEYLSARDYLDEAVVRLSRNFAITPDSTLAVALAHGTQRDGGALFEEQGVPGLYPAQDEHDSRYNELSLTWREESGYLGVAYSKVLGDHFDRVLFDRDYGTWDSVADNFYRFGLGGEAMWKVSAGLDLATLGLEGLRWDGHYAHSDEADGYTGFSRRELLSMLQYRFPGALEGLSLAWLHVNFETRGGAPPWQRKAAEPGAGRLHHP